MKEKAAELILYGRALGLSHSEAEDVLQETFLALMQKAADSPQTGALLRAQFQKSRFELPAVVVAATDARVGSRGDGLRNRPRKLRRNAPPCVVSPNCRWNNVK